MRFLTIFIILILGLCVRFVELKSNTTFSLIRRQRSIGLFKTVCYRGLGCFYTGPPFKQIPFRPISLKPLPQEIIRTEFLLFTRKNRNNPVVFPPTKLDAIFRSHFNPTAWTRILIHGYMDGSCITSWLFETKDELLRRADDNVIVVDHSTTTMLLRIIYQQSVADTRVIGVQVANLINFLHKKLGVEMKRVHIIGHSLGAHTAGYAGERLPNLGRITGLDPAGPYFRKVPRNVQLDDTDATFVDVIHSNPAPNILLDQTAFNCPHQRSYEFFLYSFNQSNCLFVGVECTSYSDFLQGKCNCGYNGEKCSIMGISATPKPPPRKRYYLEVAPERPYCLHQYQIVLYLHTMNNISKSVEIPIHLAVYGEKHKIQKENNFK
ncbi:pancreatic lipase-related protein 2, partial [Caerostris extrusa]